MDITQGAIGFIIGCIAMYIGFLRWSHDPASKLEKTTGRILVRKLRDPKRKLYRKLYRKLWDKTSQKTTEKTTPEFYKENYERKSPDYGLRGRTADKS